VKDHGWRGHAIGATVVAVFVVGGCAVADDPKRTFSLPNETGDPRLVRRCDAGITDPDDFAREFDCRNPDKGELVQPGESLDFKLYLDEDRTYVVGDAEGKTLGCLAVPLADGSDSPDSLSDLAPCPPGTPKTTQ
jgi:hypothetical protein